MDTDANQNLLREILAEVRESRQGIRALDQIVRTSESKISVLEAAAAHFSRHIVEAENSRKEHEGLNMRLAVLENNFNAFLHRETKRDERDEKNEEEREKRESALEKERRDAKRVFVYFVISQIVIMMTTIYAVVHAK